MVHLNFTDQALEDIDQIAVFISKDAPKFAGLFVEQVFEKVLPLRKHPYLGRKVPEFDRKELRELIFGRYRIVYKIIDTDIIDIVTIHHGAQQLSDKSVFG
jgi:addiction module RelE/StbE family toxin